jgi:hypothetical protein
MLESDRVRYVCSKIDEFRRNGLPSDVIDKFMLAAKLGRAQFLEVMKYERSSRTSTEHPELKMAFEAQDDLSMRRSATAARKLVQIADMLRSIVVTRLRQYDAMATFKPVKILRVKLDASYYGQLATQGVIADLPTDGWHYTSFLIISCVHVNGEENEVVVDGRICNDFLHLNAYDEFPIPDPCRIGKFRTNRRQLAMELIQPRVTNEYMNNAMVGFVSTMLSSLESIVRSPYVTTENSSPCPPHSRTNSAHLSGSSGASSAYPS